MSMKPIIWAKEYPDLYGANSIHAWFVNEGGSSTPYLNVEYLISSETDESALDYIARFIEQYKRSQEGKNVTIN